MAITPDYADTTIAPDPRRSLRASIVCALAPMCAGCLILGLFAITGWDWLMPAGFLTIAIGIIVVVIGFLLLAGYQDASKELERGEPRIIRRNTRLATLLLLSNFPVAAACTIVGIRLNPHFSPTSVTIHNNTSSTITSVTLRTGLFSTQRLGPVASGKTFDASTTFRGVTTLRWTIQAENANRTGSAPIPSGSNQIDLFVDDQNVEPQFVTW